MGFTEFKENKPVRFKEFDEARVYIENMFLNKELTYEAVDYMIKHKEYYFLLKNLIKQFANSREGNRELFDYIFLRIDECPKRKEDIELYKKIIHSKNKDLKESFLEFAKKCAEEFKEMAKNFLESEDKLDNFFGFCILIHLYDDEVKKILEKYILNTSNEQQIKEFLDYLYFYGTEENKECLKQIRERYPKFQEYIDNILKSI